MDETTLLYIKEARKIPDLTKAEEDGLAQRIAKTDSKAIDKLAEANMKRVVDLALEYYKDSPKHQHLDLLNLIQAGNTGLLRAVHNFQSDLEYRFWDYAEWWVCNEIEAALKSGS